MGFDKTCLDIWAFYKSYHYYTNDKSVATYCTAGNQAVWNVKGLEMDEAIDLFEMKVGY